MKTQILVLGTEPDRHVSENRGILYVYEKLIFTLPKSEILLLQQIVFHSQEDTKLVRPATETEHSLALSLFQPIHEQAPDFFHKRQIIADLQSGRKIMGDIILKYVKIGN
jgi:hypothetical protein